VKLGEGGTHRVPTLDRNLQGRVAPLGPQPGPPVKFDFSFKALLDQDCAGPLFELRQRT
jgi:hypothetical protein